jgi:outer membrane protein assembly factor BamB
METNWNPSALRGGPKILWNVDIGTGYSNIAIKDGSLYTMGKIGRENIIYCLDADTGEELWNYHFESSYDPQSTPTIEDKYVYALSKDGIMVCSKIKNGKVRWKKDLIEELNAEKIKYGHAGSPVIEGDLIILNANTAGIALNKKTGEKVWISEIHEKSVDRDYYATPVNYNHEGRKCALLFSGTGLFSVDVLTGEKMWFYEWRHTNVADPIVFSNKVFISTGYAFAGCVCLEIAGNNPNELWKNKNMNNEFSTSLLINGYLYGSDGTAGGYIRFRCLDFNTGNIMWDTKMRVASLISADGKLIILEEYGTLHIAEATPSAYHEISSCNVLEREDKRIQFWTPPVLCNGKIYCRNHYGDLICIDVSK